MTTAAFLPAKTDGTGPSGGPQGQRRGEPPLREPARRFSWPSHLFTPGLCTSAGAPWVGKGAEAPGQVPAAGGVKGSDERACRQLSGGLAELELCFGGNHQNAIRTFLGAQSSQLQARASSPLARDSPSLAPGFLRPLDLLWGRQVPAPPAGARGGRCRPSLGPRGAWASRSTGSRHAETPAGPWPLSARGLPGPPLRFQGVGGRPQPPLQHQPCGPSSSPQPTSPPLARLSASLPLLAIGPRRRGGEGRSSQPATPAGSGAPRLAVDSASHGLKSAPPRGAGPGLTPPLLLPGPASLGALSPQPRCPAHSLSGSVNCQRAPGSC